MLRNQVDFDLLKMVYYANFHSILSYGIIFWGSSSFMNGIFVIQKRALRTMLHLGFRQSCRGFFRDNNILTTYGLYIYIYRLLIFFSKHCHYFDSYKNLNCTRRMSPYIVPVHKTVVREKSVECAAIGFFNVLPSELQKIVCPRKFKKALYAFILRCEPYNFSEFREYCKR